MGSGKRASMREGPLAALFRKTETEGLQPPTEARAPAPAVEAAAPAPVQQSAPEPAVEASEAVTSAPREAGRVPTPQERLRHAFSSDLPENMMSPPSHTPPPAQSAPAYYPPQPDQIGSPELRVVGVGGAG